MRRNLIWVCLLGRARAQGPAAVVDISAGDTILVAGAQIKMTAVVRDSNGQPRPGDPVRWSSGDEKVLKVDDTGMVSAVGLGIAEIAVTSGNARGAIDVQVIPLRIDLLPDSPELAVGASQQFTAKVLNSTGGEMAGEPVKWSVTAESGEPSATATIGPDGLLNALALGQVTVRAAIDYTRYPPDRRNGKMTLFAASTVVSVREAVSYRLRRLVSSEETRAGLDLRPTFTGVAVNDRGQIALLGSLGGFATGLLQYEGGRFHLLASGGLPATVGGQVITQIQRPSINGLGQVLTKIGSATIDGGNQGGLFVASAQGPEFKLLEGTAIEPYIDLGFFYITPRSLNDNGQILFRANYKEPDSDVSKVALFLWSPNGSLAPVYRPGDPLPGLTGAVSVEFDFALDNAGGVLFVMRAGQQTVLYRKPSGGPAAKVIGVGDAFGGSVIERIEGLVFSPSGEAACRIDLRTGRQFLVRYTGGRVENKELNISPRTLAVNSAGDVLLAGTVAGKEGLYRWTKDEFKSVLLLGPQSGGLAAISSIEEAALATSGDVWALVRAADNDFVLLRPSAARPMVFQAGVKLDADLSVNLHLRGLVQGTRDGAPHLVLGDPASVFELTPQSLTPRVVLGERLAGGPYAGSPVVVESPKGELFFRNLFRLDGGLYRYAAGKFDRLVEHIKRMPDGVIIYEPTPLAANGNGTVVLTTGTDRFVYRMYLWKNNQMTVILSSGSATAGIGTVSAWTDAAIDERDRVMAYVQVSGSRSGYFLYENGRWTAAALMGSLQLAGRTVVAADGLRAVGDRFYALMSLGERYFESAVAEFSGSWRALLASGEQLPSGSTLGYIQDYDVNRGGDAAFVATLRASDARLLGVKTAAGLRVVVNPGDRTGDGDYLLGYLQCDLRDDGTLYFTSIDAKDNYLVYAAEPL